MPQQHLAAAFGIPQQVIRPEQVIPPEQVAIAEAVAAISSEQIAEELDREQCAAELGQEFVKNGSRDRFGNLRNKVGGRPGGVRNAHRKESRKGVGKFRLEFSAQEKLEIIKVMKDFEFYIFLYIFIYFYIFLYISI